MSDVGVNYSEPVCNTIMNHLYVDDCLRSSEPESEMVVIAMNFFIIFGDKEVHEIALDIVKVCSVAWLQLKKWTSNSRRLLSSFSEDDLGNRYAA